MRAGLGDGGDVRAACVHAETVQHALADADAAVVVTDWDVFRSIDWSAQAGFIARKGWVLDARNCTNHQAIRAAGLRLWALGKG